MQPKSEQPDCLLYVLLIFVLFSLQQLPDGSPTLVTPDLCKIDLPHLMRDIIKYNAAGIFSPATYSWWEDFLQNFEDRYASIPNIIPPWYLSELLKIRHPSDLPLIDASAVIPDKILLLRKSEAEQQHKASHS